MALVGYKDGSRLIIDKEHIVTLKTKASNKLIEYMSSERNRQVKERLDSIPRDVLKAYFKSRKKEDK